MNLTKYEREELTELVKQAVYEMALTLYSYSMDDDDWECKEDRIFFLEKACDALCSFYRTFENITYNFKLESLMEVKVRAQEIVKIIESIDPKEIIKEN